ncbi:TetR/AcrR family transcriptional regulator [Salisediminibacterium beveridgei]|uniref:TetR/AcrR family transcriptional regulator n=1 Tax=Salisediminibacterium beveridgei TaxID=632773 RepID=UPI00084807D7|nr:TetR/AcrR family transcriptional regulator [Salisediminibacterium beveridgei]
MASMTASKTILIDTAARLFQTQGYHGTGLNQIIRESGAPKGSLYYYFPDGKEQLAVAAIERTVGVVSERIFTGMAVNTDDPVTLLQGFIHHLANSYDEGQHQAGLPVAAVALEMADQSESIREACLKAYTQWHDLLAQQLMQSGLTDETAKALAATVNALVEGAFITVRLKGHAEPLRQMAEVIPALVRGIDG